MFGFIVGTVSLVFLVKVLKGGGIGRWRRGGGFGRSWMLRRVFQRLDATPGQEKVISQAVEDVEKAAFRLREQVYGGRADIARAIRGDHFDGTSFREATARQEAAFDELKKTLTESMQGVHEVLTPEQRSRLADLIEYGGGHCGHGGHGGHFGRPAMSL